MTIKPILVAAGVIWRKDGKLLISRRLPDAHLGGYWELPGGKVQPGETLSDALVRELREELAIEVTVGPEIGRVTHSYPEKTVTIVALHARYLAGTPQCLGVSDIRWIHPDETADFTFPPADDELFAMDWMNPPAGW